MIEVHLDAHSASGVERLPPYGKELRAQLAAGKTPNTYVLTGPDAWRRAERRRAQHGPGSALVLPVEAKPDDFAWPAIDAIFVDARALKRAEAISLGAAIVSYGTRYVAMLAAGDEPLNFWRGES